MEIKILVLSVSAWSSKGGMDTWPILLEGHNPDNVANICLRGDAPDSKACNNYFFISENKVLKSILKRNIKTGEVIKASYKNSQLSDDLIEHNNRYRKMKKKRTAFLLMAREIVWIIGKWKSHELKKFIVDFSPDVILYSMDGYIHFNRLCKYAKKISGAKSIGFFVDDNFTYNQSKRIGDMIFRFIQRSSLLSLAKKTNAFWAISDMTKQEADQVFGINCTLLTKPIRSNSHKVCYSKKNTPIHILYTGNLLIGRDRSLVRVCDAISQRYKGSFVIDVYTQTDLDENMIRRLESNGVCHIHSAIPQSEVLEKQKEADILLFLEDIDGPDAYTARLSFSTKITDYLSSGKCILAVGCADTAPMQYFIKNGVAAVATSEFEIMSRLEELSSNPELLSKYAEKARKIGIENHSKEKILSIFNETIISVLEEK